MNNYPELVKWCHKVRASLKRELELLESGELRTHEGRPMTDTTEKTKIRVKEWITELDGLLQQLLEKNL